MFRHLLSVSRASHHDPCPRQQMSEMAAMDSWVVSCSLCGKVIEAGTTGGGVMRYHCQDLARTDIDQQCYEQFSAARQAVDGTRAIELLRSFSSAPFGLVSQEYQNQVWLRVACKAVRPWYVAACRAVCPPEHVLRQRALSGPWMTRRTG